MLLTLLPISLTSDIILSSRSPSLRDLREFGIEINNSDDIREYKRGVSESMLPFPPKTKTYSPRVEELMALTNQLKEQIEETGNLRKELLGASVGEVLGGE